MAPTFVLLILHYFVYHLSLPLHFCVHRSLLPFKPAQCQNGLLFPFIFISQLFFFSLKKKENKKQKKRKFFS